MKENVSLLIIYFVFLVFTALFYKALNKANGIIFCLIGMIYLLFIYFYYAFIDRIGESHYWQQELYLNFGHANFELVLLFFISFFTGMIALSIVVFKRYKKNLRSNHF